MHPDALSRKRSANGEIGVVLGGDILQAFFNLKLSRKPERITEKLLWLGEIPRKIEAAGAMGKKIEEVARGTIFSSTTPRWSTTAKRGW